MSSTSHRAENPGHRRHFIFNLFRKKSSTSKCEGAIAPMKVGDEFQLGENDPIFLVEWNRDMDHVHILFKAHPNTELSTFINAYKSASSRLIKKHFPQAKRKPWKEYFWSRNFCLPTTDGSPIEVIKK